jgi:hypothetical protein
MRPARIEAVSVSRPYGAWRGRSPKSAIWSRLNRAAYFGAHTPVFSRPLFVDKQQRGRHARLWGLATPNKRLSRPRVRGKQKFLIFASEIFLSGRNGPPLEISTW